MSSRLVFHIYVNKMVPTREIQQIKQKHKKEVRLLENTRRLNIYFYALSSARIAYSVVFLLFVNWRYKRAAKVICYTLSHTLFYFQLIFIVDNYQIQTGHISNKCSSFDYFIFYRVKVFLEPTGSRAKMATANHFQNPLQ